MSAERILESLEFERRIVAGRLGQLKSESNRLLRERPKGWHFAGACTATEMHLESLDRLIQRAETMNGDKQVPVSRDDLIDAIGALELRIDSIESAAKEWEAADDIEWAQERRERAEHLRAVVSRLQAAIDKARQP